MKQKDGPDKLRLTFVRGIGFLPPSLSLACENSFISSIDHLASIHEILISPAVQLLLQQKQQHQDPQLPASVLVLLVAGTVAITTLLEVRRRFRFLVLQLPHLVVSIRNHDYHRHSFHNQTKNCITSTSTQIIVFAPFIFFHCSIHSKNSNKKHCHDGWNFNCAVGR